MGFGTIKQLARKTLPGAYRYAQKRFGHEAHMNRIAKILGHRRGGVCNSGPFQSMRLSGATTGSDIPKWLGCYEMELHEVVNEIIARPVPYGQVIDVGCGEGYYAVGLALRIPGAVVHAYDINPAARAACAEGACLNGVERRVRIGGECTPPMLGQLAGRDTLIVCDCEGYEDELLDPVEAPALRQCDLLVELHDGARPGLTTRLTARFSSSHTIKLIDTAHRDAGIYRQLDGLSTRDRQMAVNESRGAPMQWAWMTANDALASA